jgi:hypothetical protein
VPPVRDIRNACRILAGNPERKMLLRRFKTLRQENTKMYLKEIRNVDIIWIPVDQSGHQRWALLNN